MNNVTEMDLDPRKYDLGELHVYGQNETNGAADDGFVYPEDRRAARAAEEALKANNYRELLLLQSQARADDLRKPYLDALPTTLEAERRVLEWLEFLVETGGYKRACTAVRHYRALGWLSEPVEHGLRDYLTGVPEGASDGSRSFERSDHLLSLIYIGRIARAS